ncbi:MAG: hypothetical protein NTW09_01010 [Candidatus Omnitrophica bacterium]|nr:hypothetical protein [Candidatus Omnitrophota bacterium]
MSIVQEAMKKAQNIRYPEIGRSPSRNTLGNSLGRVALLIIFIVLLGATIKQVSFSSGKSGAKTGSPIVEAIYKPISSIDMKTNDSPIAETYTNSAAGWKVAKERFPDFVLNGIMELVDGPRAIVNNVIVATGDIIGGATVRKIDKDRVVLQKEDSVITLGME